MNASSASSPAPSPHRAAAGRNWGLFSGALGLLAVFLTFVHASQSDKPAVVTPPDSAIVATVDANLYGLLARGFLRGQLNLDAEPPAALVQARNPYDPAQRPRVLYLHDTSLYSGKYYIYFGPAPAVLLFAPWRLVAGADLPASHAALVFVSVAYLGLLAVYRLIRRDCFPDASRWTDVAAAIALGGAAMVIPLLRRPNVYEVAISCGLAAAVWGLYCAWRSGAAARGAAWAAACGACFGVAVASRPTFGLIALPATLLLIGRRVMPAPATGTGGATADSSASPGSSPTLLLRCVAAACTGAFILGLILWYNHARFGDALEFGQKYQLSGQNEGAVDHFGLRFVRPQLWFYFVSPLRLAPYFPFLQEVRMPKVPADFGAHEFSFGVLPNLPVLWFGAAAIFVAWRRRSCTPVVIALALAALASAIPLLFFFGSCVRYQAEFAPWLALLAVVGALGLDAMVSRRARPWVAGLVLAAAAASLLITLLASVDMYNPTRHTAPVAFDRLGRWLNRPLIAWNASRGREFGPVDFVLDTNRLEGRVTLLTTEGPSGSTETVTLERVGETQARLEVRRTGRDAFARITVVPLRPGGEQTVRVSLGSLYPQRAIEMPAETPRELFRRCRLWALLEWNGEWVFEEAVPIPPWRTRATRLATVDPRGPVRAVRRGQPLASSTAPPAAGIRVRVRIDGALAGHCLPLVTTGHHGRGNFLFLCVDAEGRVRFGYDHWGKPSLISAPIAIEGPHPVIEFWMPAILNDARRGNLRVRVDGRLAWEASVPFYRTSPSEVYIGRNPLGGTSCQREFPGLHVEATNLAP